MVLCNTASIIGLNNWSHGQIFGWKWAVVTHHMSRSRDQHSTSTTTTTPLTASERTRTKNLADIEVRRERGERMNVSENSNVLSGAEYHFYTGWVLTGEIFQSSVSDWLALTILSLNMKLNTNYRVYCLYWNWSSALLGNNHCNNGFKHILNYWLCSTTDPSVYFIYEIGILEIRFEFGNWFVKEYFWWMICVAVTVGCWVSAGWLKSFINMNPQSTE